MIKHKTKNLKPISYSINFIYRCPSCSIEHWLSLQETQTKGFKTVCDCGVVFRVKLIKDIKIIYQPKIVKIPQTQEEEKSPVSSEEIKQPEIKPEPPKPQISSNLLQKCCGVLLNYGFTQTESENLVSKAFENNPINDCAELVKYTISTIGDHKNG